MPPGVANRLLDFKLDIMVSGGGCWLDILPMTEATILILSLDDPSDEMKSFLYRIKLLITVALISLIGIGFGPTSNGWLGWG